MVKSVQSEPHLESLLQNLVFKQGVNSRVGLLIGKKAVGSRDLLFSIIRTPQQDGTDAIQVSSSSAAAITASKGKKVGAPASSSSVVSIKLDVAWIQEHAEQVSRSLPGGMSVLGLFIICPESGLSSALEAIKSGPGPLFLHVDSPSGKVMMKANEGGTLKPCELKFSSSISSLIKITCSHAINVSLPVEALDLNDSQKNKQSFHDLIASAVKCEARRIDDSLAISSKDHQLLPGDQPLIEVIGNEPVAPGAIRTFDILLASPAFPSSNPMDLKQSSTEGKSHLSGTIRGIAIVHNRESMGKAVSDIKLDLTQSLSMRLELMLEDALNWEEEENEAGESMKGGGKRHPLMSKRGGEGSLRWSGSSFVLPARAEIPLNVNGTVIPLVDYLLQGEVAADVVERSMEILDLEINESSLVVMEERTNKPKAIDDMEVASHQPISTQSKPEDMQPMQLSNRMPTSALLLAIFALLLALALGYYTMR